MNLFAEIVGHDEQLELLQSLVRDNHLPHALCLWGSKGIGKTKIAISLAKQLLSLHLTPDKSDLVSSRVDHKNHPDFWILNKEKDKKNILVEQIDEMQQKAFIKAEAKGSLKVFILIEPELLNQSAANRFLKLLEEPPQNVFFILISHDKSSILPTISSRCQHYFFGGLNSDQVKIILTKVDDAKLNELDESNQSFLANISMGSPGKAIELLSKEIFFLKNKFESTFIGVERIKPWEVRGIFDDYLALELESDDSLDGLNKTEMAREKVKFVFELLQIFLRELIYTKNSQQNDCNLWFNNGLEENTIDSKVLLNIMNEITGYIKSVRENSNISLVLETFALDVTNAWNTN